MNKTLIIIAFLFVLPMFGQYNKATINFKSGKELNGLIKFNAKGAYYKEDESSKKIRLNSLELDCIRVIYEDGFHKEKTYCYRYIKNNKLRRVELLVIGKVTLYKFIKTKRSGGFGGVSFEEVHYYGFKKNEKVLTKILNLDGAFAKGFKKATSKYFNDCPKLVSLINAGQYKKNEIEDVVNYYNKNCE